MKFDAEMVYETLCDFTNLLDSYVNKKDDFLYNNYAREFSTCCPQCHFKNTDFDQCVAPKPWSKYTTHAIPLQRVFLKRYHNFLATQSKSYRQ